jgi:trk system potassium uptake protein TrkH
MNYASVIRMLGALCAVLGLAMLVPLAWAIGLGESEAVYGFVVSVGLTWILAFLLFFGGHHGRAGLHRKEGLAVVGLGWFLASILGALPYLFSGSIPNAVDAVFETMSGFTTTGASVVENLPELPRSILFWRDFTHWLGGMGIIVLFIAILPHIGVGARYLFRSEVPGAVKEAVTPRVKDTALFLWKAYTVLTLAEVLLLRLSGMDWLESFCHTFGTMATGGFSTRPQSIGAYDSVAIELIVIVFMILAGTNFALYRPLLRRGPSVMFRDIEWRAYLLILGGGTVLLGLDLLLGRVAADPLEALRKSLFQVVSVGTTTGYVTDDFDTWPSVSRLFLFFLMFVGGCSGSTGGSMKVMRIVVLLRFGWAAVRKVFRPQEVTAMKLGDTTLREEVVREILAFFVLFLGIFLIASLLLSIMGLDPITSMSAVAANLGNVGPGLGGVGASETYAAVPALGKILLVICMVVGRLEVYTILVLFSPAFWRR